MNATVLRVLRSPDTSASGSPGFVRCVRNLAEMLLADRSVARIDDQLNSTYPQDRNKVCRMT